MALFNRKKKDEFQKGDMANKEVSGQADSQVHAEQPEQQLTPLELEHSRIIPPQNKQNPSSGNENSMNQENMQPEPFKSSQSPQYNEPSPQQNPNIYPVKTSHGEINAEIQPPPTQNYPKQEIQKPNYLTHNQYQQQQMQPPQPTPPQKIIRVVKELPQYPIRNLTDERGRVIELVTEEEAAEQVISKLDEILMILRSA